MSHKGLREASDILRESSEDVRDDETRDRLREQSDQLRALADRDRKPDHGRLARHQHVLRDISERCEPIAEELGDVNEMINTIRENIEGI